MSAILKCKNGHSGRKRLFKYCLRLGWYCPKCGAKATEEKRNSKVKQVIFLGLLSLCLSSPLSASKPLNNHDAAYAKVSA